MKKDVSNNMLEEMFIVDSANIRDNQIIQNCFDVVSVFVAAIDLEGNISFVNIRATEVLGQTKEKIIGKNFIDNFIMEEKQDETKMLFDSVLAGKSFYDDNTRYFIRGDQHEQRIIESKNVTIRDANKKIYGILISGHDVTEYVKKQKDLQTDLNLYRILANNIPDINLFLFDKNMKFVLAEGNEMKNNDQDRHFFEENLLKELPDTALRKIWTPLFTSALSGRRVSMEYSYNNYYYYIWVVPIYSDENELIAGVAITENITEDKQIERKLKKAKDEAERANQSKTDFLARVSHEIRTPLNAILGFTEQLKQSKLNENQKEYADIIDKSSEHLLSLINDILVLSKIEAGQIRFEKSPFKLTYTIEYLYNAMLVKAKEKNLKFTYHVDKNLDMVLIGDQFRLRQILINLLSNAIKFTGSGSVQLNCSLVEENKDIVKVKFDVIDTGIGIHPKNLTTIFQRFKQANPSISRTYGGTGLGLAICKNLIDLQAGSLSVSSEENVGTTFSFTIPYKRGNNKNMIPEDLGDVESKTLKGTKVLLVDDDHFNRLLAKTILDKFGCETIIAASGSEAIGYIDQERFDIILLDIHMSEISGIEVAEFIRNKRKDNDTKILAVTAAVLKDDVHKYFRVGINDFLIKPFKEINLFNKMCDLLDVNNSRVHNETEQTIIKESSHRKLYDLSELINMANGNQSFIDKMLLTFIENSENTIHLLKRFLKEENWLQAGEAAHKILPSYRHLKVHTIVNKLSDLKTKTLVTNEYIGVPELIKETIELMNGLLDELKKELNE